VKIKVTHYETESVTGAPYNSQSCSPDDGILFMFGMRKLLLLLIIIIIVIIIIIHQLITRQFREFSRL